MVKHHFPTTIINDFHINEKKNDISIKDKLKIIKNNFYNKEAYYKLSELIEKEKPDIAYVLQYGSKLSISIFDACSKHKLPVVLRLSDFNLVCAKNIFFRNGKTCTKCISNKLNSVKYKCVHDSLSQSFFYYLSQKFNQLRKFEKQIDAYIAPSKFTIDLIKQNKQFSSSNFYHIPTFIEHAKLSNKIPSREHQQKNGIKLCYWGRIDEDKGIDILIDAIKSVTDKGFKISLTIIGNTDSNFAKKQIQRKKELKLDNIFFSGYIHNEEIYELISDSHYSVIPSKWYDNMPNSLIESCTLGIPPIVSQTGSLNELINDGVNGFSFTTSNSKALSEKIQSLYKLDEKTYNQISDECMRWINNYCDRKSHYKKLVDVFNQVIHEKNNK